MSDEKPSLLEVVREGFMQTLGKITLTREAAEQTVQRTVNRLVELGKLTQDEAKNFTNELKSTIEKNRQDLERKIDDSVHQAMAVNHDALFLGIKACAPLLSEAVNRHSGGGAIINNISMASFMPNANNIGYHVSKAAARMLTLCAAIELGP